MGQITIKDVAREAGVSISTVSNALNDVDVLHPDTKAHILAVAERLHYIPNLNGRNLKSKATKVLGLFVNSMSGPYYGELADAIERVCQNNGYELHIFITKKSSFVMANLLGKRVDGGIFLNAMIKDNHIKDLQEAKIPLVFLDRECIGEKMTSVVFDSYLAGRTAAEYLMSWGSTKIGYVRGIMNTYDGVERDRGFLDGLKEKNIDLSSDFIWDGEFRMDVSRHSMKQFLEKNAHKSNLPEAIFAANDQSAMGCIEALQEAGIRVPEDIAVLGCDDIELAKWFQPPLSTIKTSAGLQGTLAAEKLIALLNGKVPDKIEKIKGTLVERESAFAKPKEQGC